MEIEMIKKERLKELEQYNSENLDNLIKMNRNMKKTGKIIKIIAIVAFIVIIFNSIISTSQIKYSRIRKNLMKTSCNNDIEEISSGTDIFGNGFYIYKLEDISNIEIHSFFHKSKNIFIEDSSDRIYKYFWEKWGDSSKSNFIVKEKYEDYKYKLISKKDWILNYETYIEVNNYEEMLEAVEDIIRFKSSMGNYSSIIISSYIKIGNQTILPNNVSPQTNDEIRESAKKQYEEIMKNYNSD